MLPLIVSAKQHGPQSTLLDLDVQKHSVACRRGNNNGYAYANAGPRIWFSPTDVFWYLDPYYMRRRRMRQETGQGMNFLEAIFSFVFGDGNPNESYEDRRWRLVSSLPC